MFEGLEETARSAGRHRLPHDHAGVRGKGRIPHFGVWRGEQSSHASPAPLEENCWIDLDVAAGHERELTVRSQRTPRRRVRQGLTHQAHPRASLVRQGGRVQVRERRRVGRVAQELARLDVLEEVGVRAVVAGRVPPDPVGPDGVRRWRIRNRKTSGSDALRQAGVGRDRLTRPVSERIELKVVRPRSGQNSARNSSRSTEDRVASTAHRGSSAVVVPSRSLINIASC